MLWTVDDMIAATGARPVGEMPEGVEGISIDTRTLQPGDAFFAIKGDRFDGHDFMTFAMKAGAILAVVSADKLVALGSVHIPLLVVRDVMEAMRMLAQASRERSAAKIIAITGSVGKTSTKEMMRTVLEASGEVHASAASFNNHWGVPLSLARMPQSADFGIFEIGMNHPDEIRPLVKLVSPHIAVVTNIAPAHLGNFKSLAAIARAKAEIFEGVTKKGDAVINRDSRYFGQLSKAATAAGVKNIYSFGARSRANFKLISLKQNKNGSVAVASIAGIKTSFALKAPGEHLVYNALAVLGVASLAGADLEKSISALGNVMPAAGRGQQHQIAFRTGTITLIDESYNANPASMEAALDVLGSIRPHGKGRRIAVLGDMRELGRNSAKLHKALANPIMACNADLVMLAGSEIEPLSDELIRPFFAGHFANAQDLLKSLQRKLIPGDVVLVKASNGMNFATIVDGLLAPETAAAVQ